MAKTEMQSGCSMEKDPRNGYSSKTKTFHSLRQPPHLPPETLAISVTDYVFSLLRSAAAGSPDFSLDTADFIIDATADRSVTYSSFLRQVHSLTLSLPPLAKGQVALILSPPSPCVPVLYFALLSLGVVVSPANPLATESELIHMIKLSNPVVAFADSSVSHKLPPLPLGTILLNSSDFDSILTRPVQNGQNPKRLSVSQSDSAAILYSSGTTGRVKGVELTHRNFIAMIAGSYHNRVVNERAKHLVALLTVPLFHVFGFFEMMEMAAMADTMVLMERFDFEKMLRAVEKYKITSMLVSPPIVVAMEKSELTEKYDLSSLEFLRCGGAPLGKDVIERFKSKFPNIILVQGYGLTETVGGGALMRPPETKWFGSVGRLTELMEAKIVNPMTREAMPPGQQGELWLRGPTIMKGYVGDKDATAAMLDPEGWLKTGDLCYFDFDGFLCIVGRLKELIKYKAYQVPPAELERLLLTHPEIADAAVIPYPDEEAGEIPMALVVRKPDTHVTAAQVIDFVARQVAPYKKIRRVSFINSIPKNPAGKILRRELINQAVSGASARL
ncbi:hypothetical protein Nepgr_003006 [Nepenthes gracilis]|uniref:4-coumarate--CoA ligase n=1 Tax=Nepenthes gracilis TaxID=150966 RepID=A0AAD3XCR8_NEPGR|nr:hypothetical protein Nepgr_003006 [Nepenthes gracilis]